MESVTIYGTFIQRTGTLGYTSYCRGDYVLNPSSLTWNDGAGHNVTTNCLDAEGGEFTNIKGNELFYIGDGTPSESPQTAAQASALVGRGVWKRAAVSSGSYYYGGVSDTGRKFGASQDTCDYWTRSASTSNANRGTVSFQTPSKWDSGEASLSFESSYYSATSVFTSVQGSNVRSFVWASPPKSGYRFAGWYVNGSKVTSTSSSDSVYVAGADNRCLYVKIVYRQDIEAEAVYEEILYTYTFDANGGAVSPESAQGGVETTVTIPAPVREGYTFDGWYTAASGGTRYAIEPGDAVHPTSNRILYAHWTANTYTIAFNANTGTGAAMQSVSATYDVSASLPACTYTKTGSLFVGWNTAADGSGTAYADGATVINLTAEDGATVTLYAQWKTLHTITAAQVGSADVVDLSVEPAAATTTGGVDYWTEGTRVAVTVTPRAGKLLNGGGISVNNVSQGGFTNPTPSAPYTFDMEVTGDTVIVPTVEVQTFTCAATIDAASEDAGAITAVSVSPANVAYGGSATFSATVKDGYSFAGFFDSEGNFVNAGTLEPPSGNSSENSVYTYTVSNVTAPIALVAKAAAAVSLSLNSTDYAALFVDGTECAGGSYNETLVVGTTIAYELAIDGGYGLDAWRSDAAILPLGTSGTIYVDAAVDATATILVDSALDRKITVHALSGSTGETPLNIGDGFITFTGAAEQQAESASELGGGGAQPEAEEEPGNTCEEHFVGTKTVRATAQNTVETNDGTLYFYGWFEAIKEVNNNVVTYHPAANSLSQALALNILTNENKVFFVRYVEDGEVDVTVGATNDSGEHSGNVWITRISGGTVTGGETTTALKNVPLGSDVTVHARSRNGYRFDGWYNTPDPTVFTPLSSSETFTFTVYGETAYYARFVLDRNAICEWEGSDENKTMVWRSKVYVASKPFNPTSARVDADGYPVELAVGAWSSPDVAATSNRTAGILVRDQDARRLPMMRAERYLRIDVVSDSPVNAVFVGTSMEGLAV